MDIKNQQKCSGCGAQFQNNDPKKEGYINPEFLTWDHLVCERCFKLKNYNQDTLDIKTNLNEIILEIEKAIKKSDLLIFVVDILDIDVIFNDILIKLIKKKPVILAITKIDLIKLHPSKISDWVKEKLSKINLNIINFSLISNKNKYGVAGLLKKNEDYLKTAVLGISNSGKSSLINNMLEFTSKTSNNKKRLTESKLSGTTLKNIEIRLNKSLDKNKKIIDTPGIFFKNRLIENLCINCNNILIPNKLKIQKVKISNNQILCLAGLVKIKLIDFEAKNNVSFFIFGSDKLNIKIFNKKNENIEKIILKEVVPPCEICQEYFEAKNNIKSEFELNKTLELYIAGLGWVYSRYYNGKIEVEYPKDAMVISRKALGKFYEV